MNIKIKKPTRLEETLAATPIPFIGEYYLFKELAYNNIKDKNISTLTANDVLKGIPSNMALTRGNIYLATAGLALSLYTLFNYH